MSAQPVDLDAIERRITARMQLFRDRSDHRHIASTQIFEPLPDLVSMVELERLIALARQAQQPAGGIDGVIAAIEARIAEHGEEPDPDYVEYVAGLRDAKTMIAAAQAAGIEVPQDAQPVDDKIMHMALGVLLAERSHRADWLTAAEWDRADDIFTRLADDPSAAPTESAT